MKIKLLFAFLITGAFMFQSNAQTLNQNASWPNASWTFGGTFNAGAVLADPTVDANASYDDDAAGSGSTDIIEITSPVIDLTAASGAGETNVTVEYAYNYNLGGIFDLEYFDADASSWVVIEAVTDNSSTISNWCGSLQTAVVSTALDISSFTPTQLSGFQYRFFYDASSVFGWGFCLSSPTISSSAPPVPPSNDACANAITIMDGDSLSGDTTLATNVEALTPCSGGTVGLACATGVNDGTINFGAGVWYVYSSGGNESISIEVGGFDTEVQVFSGMCGSLTCVAGDDDSGAAPNNSGVCFDATTATDFYIYVDGHSSNSGVFNIDLNVTPFPECLAPTSLTAINITATTADLGWTENGTATAWNVELVDVTAGGMVTGTATATGVMNPYNATMLTPDNNYAFYVQADCGVDGTSDWVGPFSFTTACAPLTAPYLEDFEMFTTSSSAFAAENCWSATGGSYFWESAPGTDTGSSDTGPDPSITTGNYFYVEASAGADGATTDLVSPLVDLSTLTVPALSFDYHMYGSNMGTLEVLVNGVTSVWSLTGQQQASATTPWETAVIDLSAFPGQTISVTFRGTKIGGLNDFRGDISIDNVSFDELPACPTPTALTATNIDAFSADLSWTENGSATSWNVELVDVTAMGTATGTATTSGVMNPYSLTGLTPENDYAYYIQAVCGMDTSAWAGPFAFSTTIACTAPSALAATNITATTADLGWTENGTATTWDIEIVTSGTTPTGTPTNIGVTTNPYGATMLTADTAYQFYVRADCGGMNGVSSWTGPFSFRTDCAAFIPNYLEDFTSFIPGCWQEATGPITGPTNFGTGPWTSDGFGNNGTSGSARFNIFSTGSTGWLISPTFDMSSGGYEINLDVALTTFSGTTQGDINADDAVYVMQSIDNGATWSTIFTWDENNEPSNVGDNTSIDVSTVTSSTTKFAVYIIEGATSGGDFNFYVDNFQVRIPPSCPAPSSLTATNIDASSADLGWSAGGTETLWNVELVDVTAGGMVTGTATANGVANPYIVAGLSSDNDYEFYVQADCGGMNGVSTWSGPFSFSTPLDYCAGDAFSDPGGPTGDYGTNENETYTICPDNPGDKVVINFSEFSFENDGSNCWDGLTIYDGDVATGTVIPSPGGTTDVWCWDRDDANPTGSGDLLGVSIAATTASGCITIVLTSDFSVTREGFTATASCESTVYLWDGTAWSNAPEGSITVNDNLYVNSGGAAALTAGVSAENVYVDAGASLDASNGDLTTTGNLVNYGAVTGTNAVVLNGASADVSGTGSVENLTVGAAGVVTVSGSQSVTGTLDVLSGGSLDAAGNVTMVSNAMGTARVDEMDAGAIIGDVNVQRYIPAGNRAFRFIGPVVTGATVFDSWQEAGNNAAGFGTHITGTAGTVGTNNTTTGHDETDTGGNSMFKWDNASQAFIAVTNTKTEILNAGDYYNLFIRGDRTTNLSINNPLITATTLRSSGSLLQTSMVVTPGIASGEFFPVTNPYQSKVSMAGTATGTTADMYYWDPNLGTNGGYAAINIATGTSSAGPSSNILEAGQAVFFVDNSGASSVTVAQSNKVTGTTDAAVFSSNTLQQALRLKLYQTSRYTNNQSESDGLYIDFDTAHNLNIDSNDAVKFDGANVNMSISKTTGEFLTVERRTLPTVDESIQLNVVDYLTTNYTMVATVDVLPGVTAYLKDNYDGSLTELIQGTSTPVSFTVDVNDALSIDAARFELVFQMVTLSNEDLVFGDQVSLYPNPVNGDVLNISFGNAAVDGAIQVTLFNTLGQQVVSKNFDNLSNGIISLNNLSKLESGLYIVNLNNGLQTITRKIIID